MKGKDEENHGKTKDKFFLWIPRGCKKNKKNSIQFKKIGVKVMKRGVKIRVKIRNGVLNFIPALGSTQDDCCPGGPLP